MSDRDNGVIALIVLVLLAVVITLLSINMINSHRHQGWERENLAPDTVYVETREGNGE